MLQHQQYVESLTQNGRPQSSPSDNSMSTATPPHQVSRASPASTALVMSSTNINNVHSRQLTPNTNSSNSNNGGTGSSTGSAGSSNAGTSVNGAGNNNNTSGPPNPMIRQFACHAKSMSAGVVVSVPGISNNLATATGMNQNNFINNNIAHTNNHRALPPLEPIGQGVNMQPSVNQNQPLAHHRGHHAPQQVIREHKIHHHQPSLSQPAPNHNQLLQHRNHHQQQQQQQQQMQQMQQYQQQYNSNPQNHHSQNGSSSNFVNARHATSSNIILSHNNHGNPNNIHNRSASTHLSSHLLGPNNHQSQHMMGANQHHHNHSRQHSNTNYPPHVTNSIWSIDETISKSQGKLTATSGYLPHPYLFNPSITDMSCDNVSNVSRLIDGPPAPGYYLHAPPSGNLRNPKSNALSASGSIKGPEFLPICDLMFNLISMIIYFCENTFGIIALIALYCHAASKHWALMGAAFVFASNFVCQYLSFKWLYKAKLEDCRRKREAQEELEEEEDCERFYNRMAANMRDHQCGSCTWLPGSAQEVQLKFLLSIALDAITHIFCLGFLVRYIKLVIPVKDTARVKRDARDLCMLRMMHGFIQSAPLLLLQAYITCSQTSTTNSITNLSVTSAILSLVNLCWALASFTKYARKKHIHKFVLTWLGIVSQFLWRLGTISSRVVALTIYAVYYGYWMLVVLALHWITMFLWLINPGNLLRDEVNLSRPRKISVAMAVAWTYCFCYMNFDEHNSKVKMTSYYMIMFLENNLLLTVYLIFPSQATWFKNLSILVVCLGFLFGMLFMFIYYQYFHINVLNNGLSRSQESVDSIADQLSPAGKKIAGFKPGTLRLKSEDSLTSGHRFNTSISTTLNHTGSHPEITRNIKPSYLTSNQAPHPQSGVFNCKLNPALKKQKRPSSHARRHNQ